VTGELTEIPLTSDRWNWGTAQPAFVDHLGRAAARFPDAFELATLDGARLSDGIVELDLAVTRQRSFPGVAWHVADPRNQETFFVRPHQVGNPDAIQYTPVTNGISSWHLYHGPGFWAPIVFPIGDWFTIRVAFSSRRATAHVADLTAPSLVIDEQKLAATTGGIGLLVAGPGLHVARFAYADATPSLPEPMSPPRDPTPGIIPSWWVSEPFEEARLGEQLTAEHRWTRLDAEPSGLTDLARASGLEGERNTVLARATLGAARDGVVPLEIGFSDRAVVFLDGRPLFRGDDAYRTRDYRFLGSIGWWDTVYLPLRQGASELVVAVSETFGGWGLQARLPADAAVSIQT
jgi:hypothetical protein